MVPSYQISFAKFFNFFFVKKVKMDLNTVKGENSRLYVLLKIEF